MALRKWLGAPLALTALVALAWPDVSAADDNARGKTLFSLCQHCHGENGGGNEEFLAPAIAGLAQWYVQSQLQKFQGGLRGKHFDDIAGMRMRPMALTLRYDGDVEAVSAYVASLPPVDTAPTLVGGDPERGKQMFTPCVACHGANGQGNKALFGPPIAHSSDWYLFRQLENFKKGIRGAAPGDQTGAMMRPMAMTLADDQAMKDVIAHIMTLAN